MTRFDGSQVAGRSSVWYEAAPRDGGARGFNAVASTFDGSQVAGRSSIRHEAAPRDGGARGFDASNFDGSPVADRFCTRYEAAPRDGGARGFDVSPVMGRSSVRYDASRDCFTGVDGSQVHDDSYFRCEASRDGGGVRHFVDSFHGGHARRFFDPDVCGSQLAGDSFRGVALTAVVALVALSSTQTWTVLNWLVILQGAHHGEEWLE